MTNEKKILIAEDEIAAAETLCEYLNFHGYNCDIESDGSRVTKKITDDTDAIILDINLAAGPTGLQLLPEIKKSHPTIKTLIITGDNIPENRLKSLQLGADYFFSKPINLPLLLTHLKDSTHKPKVA